ncbi:DUF4126 family protein [Mucilaginibacter terrigena]|uniref:DUF4126 family protein n=1 Tax=Mucilaginibacter terrigena TaxID=2492395 RepID=A0A4V1ZCD2_9SPHI|nr:DUF4126 family protein [Mucilaginibacter terrigena]RYU92250.1 DUF4126 family protein [Mucilaginibacter terrigena]
MELKLTHAFRQAAGLGIIAGMRTFSAPAVISHVYSRHPERSLKKSPFQFIQTIGTSKVFKVLAAGELVGDKLPFAPKRTNAGGLIGRFAAGALCGATVYKADNKKPIIGGLIGGTAAIASAFGCMFLRIGLGKKTGIPDPVIGAIEDVIVISAATALAKDL